MVAGVIISGLVQVGKFESLQVCRFASGGSGGWVVGEPAGWVEAVQAER